jgi:hypothetical protein
MVSWQGQINDQREERMSKRYLYVLAAAVLLGACSSKKSGTEGKAPENATPATGSTGPTVKFHYTLTVDGKAIDSSVGKEPMSVTLGTHNIVPGLEEALATMKTGEKRTVTLSPEQGYGPYRQEGVQKVPKTAFKDGLSKPGSKRWMPTASPWT